METLIKTTASTKFTPKELLEARSEAKTASSTKGRTRLGIRFEKLHRLLILF